jgi:large subunit ribosomal protein L18
MSIQKATKKFERRRTRVRSRVTGTPARPRLSVFRSNKHLYAQVIDDTVGNTLAAATTNTKAVKEGGKSFANLKSAAQIGREIAERAKASGVTAVVFDRGGFQYHGVIKAVAEAAREAGLQF